MKYVTNQPTSDPSVSARAPFSGRFAIRVFAQAQCHSGTPILLGAMLFCLSTLSLCGQNGILCPNQIRGTNVLSNAPDGPVMQYLTTHRVTGGRVTANSLSPALWLSASASLTPIATNSATYAMSVHTDCTGNTGYVFRVQPYFNFYAGGTYYFAAKDADPVYRETNADVVLNFSESAGLLNIRFLDAPGGNPMPVPYASATGYATNESQASASRSGQVTNLVLVVRGDVPSYRIYIRYQTGTDFYTDAIYWYTNIVTGTIADHQVDVECVVITNSPALGRIIGRVDMLGIEEHGKTNRSPYYYTTMRAEYGPLDNSRYDWLPRVPSSGDFELENLLPSETVTPPLGYAVHGYMYFGSGRQFEVFQTPYLSGANGSVMIPAGTTVDLGDTFVMAPGYIQGAIHLYGASEVPYQPGQCDQSESSLRFLIRGSDTDADEDGLPDAGFASSVYGSGLSQLAPGATKSAYGGSAGVEFAGDFNPAAYAFVGGYRMVVGGLLQESSRWQANRLYLRFLRTSPPASALYENSSVRVEKYLPTGQIIDPGATVTNDHRYCLSRIIVHLRSTAGTFYSPSVSGNGYFSGLDFENNPAEYYAYVSGSGTPLANSAATNVGDVVLAVPQGTYDLTPSVQARLPGGGSSSTTLPLIQDYEVGCQQCIIINPDLQLQVTVTNCTPIQTITVGITVTGVTNVTGLFYRLNDGPTVTLCSDCGLNPATNLSLVLRECENALTVTAIDSMSQTASVSSVIRFLSSSTPPVFEGCTNQVVTAPPGANAAEVHFSVTAYDNCSSNLAATCHPLPGASFEVGTNTVVCHATDFCGNSGTCSFTITVESVSNCDLICSSNVVVNANPDQCTATVHYALPSLANCPGYALTCIPPPGWAFAVGVNDVVCLATSGTGDSRTCSFHVTVLDATPPTLTCPSSLTVAAGTNCQGAIPDVLSLVQAADNCSVAGTNGSSLVLTQSPPAGSIVGLGTNWVTVTASDSAGNSAQCVIPLMVVDTMPPELACPADLAVECVSPDGTRVPFSPVATDACNNSVIVHCVPPSGSLFLPGPANVTCTAVDAWGNARSCSFAVTVFIREYCPVADSQALATCEDTALPVTITATDANTGRCGASSLTCSILQPPTHGTLAGAAPNVTYQPDRDYHGPDSFTFKVSDGLCESGEATVSITVKPVNDAPVCRFIMGPLLKLTPNVTENMVLSCDNLKAAVVLDASLSSDVDSAELTYTWYDNGVPIGTGPIITNDLSVGTRQITLVVDDGDTGTAPGCVSGGGTDSCTKTVTVITGAQAVEEVVLLLEETTLDRKTKRPFIATLKAACSSFDRGNCVSGVNQLDAFQNKAKAQIAKEDPAAAQPLIDAVQAVVEAFRPCGCWTPGP